MLARLSLVACLALSAALPAQAATDADAIGLWRNPDNGAILEFYVCDGDLCARIAKPSQAGLKDDKNPDESKRGQPLEGLVILSHAKKSGEASWAGELYNTQDGKSYSGSVRALSTSELELKGCFLSVFCKTLVLAKTAAQ